MDPSEIARCHVYTALARRGFYRQAPRAGQWFYPPSPLSRGMGQDVISKLITVAGEMITIPEGAPSPGQMYAEAAPRVLRILKQYDEASPKIDWINENWAALSALLLIGGAVAVIGGNLVYDKLIRKHI